MPVATEDITAVDPVDGGMPAQTGIVTTLYDLIATLNDQLEPGEDDVTTAAVVHLCNTGKLRFLRVNGTCEVWSAPNV
jgi:hypothetical protein